MPIYKNANSTKGPWHINAECSPIKRSACGWFIPARRRWRLPAHKQKAVTASSHLASTRSAFRSLRSLQFSLVPAKRQLAVLVSHPQPLKGRTIARAPSYHAPPSVPEIREINIIYRDCVTPRIKGLPPQERHQSSWDRGPPRPTCPLRVYTI